MYTTPTFITEALCQVTSVRDTYISLKYFEITWGPKPVY